MPDPGLGGTATSADRGVLLAFDFGFRRIGVASGNLLTRTATPVTTVRVGDDIPWAELDRIVREWAPDKLIVGMPGNTDRPVNAAIGAFLEALRGRYGLPVESVDESLSSHAAASALREKRRSGYLRRRVNKAEVDRHAACLIAEQWMSRHA